MKLLVLDVEGTIITNYDYMKEEEDGRFPAIIQSSLKNELKRFYEAGIKIVLATGTDGADLEYYRAEFKKAGFADYISAYSPNHHSASDGKEDKLRKYATQFNVNANDIFFFDDGESNVTRAKNSGFENSFQVTDASSLTQQLRALADRKLDVSPIANVSSFSIAAQHNQTLMSATNEYQLLPLAFRQYLSEYSQRKRHTMSHISTEQFWLGLSKEQKTVWQVSWQQHKQLASPLDSDAQFSWSGLPKH